MSFSVPNRYAIPPEHGKRLERLATGRAIPHSYSISGHLEWGIQEHYDQNTIQTLKQAWEPACFQWLKDEYQPNERISYVDPPPTFPIRDFCLFQGFRPQEKRGSIRKSERQSLIYAVLFLFKGLLGYSVMRSCSEIRCSTGQVLTYVSTVPVNQECFLFNCHGWQSGSIKRQKRDVCSFSNRP